VTLDVR